MIIEIIVVTLWVVFGGGTIVALWVATRSAMRRREGPLR